MRDPFMGFLVAYTIGSLVIFGAAVFVVVHFISKYW